MGKLKENMIPFITEDDIKLIIKDLARQIERDYDGEELILVCPLKGSVIFCADLCRELSLPVIIDFVHLTSPKNESVRIHKDISVNILNKHVLIVEEIVDAGRTLSFLRERILASHPASLKILSLLDKPARREQPIQLDYVGKTIDDRFVIGYGLDSEEIGRNYKDIYNFTQ